MFCSRYSNLKAVLIHLQYYCLFYTASVVIRTYLLYYLLTRKPNLSYYNVIYFVCVTEFINQINTAYLISLQTSVSEIILCNINITL